VSDLLVHSAPSSIPILRRGYIDTVDSLIITNRHVVGAGPFTGYVVFDNHEEADAYPVYRDPVHDFGILRFDPKAIKYMPVSALTLRPDLAKGGQFLVFPRLSGQHFCAPTLTCF
jgi:S1-C subfamily serine protease